MFKKILLILMISILGFGVVGCSDSNKKEKLNITPKENAEEVVCTEYITRLGKVVQDTIYNYEEDNKYDKYEKEYEKEHSSKDDYNSNEYIYGDNKERYKDLIEGITKFKPDDENIDKLHDKIIEVSSDIYNKYTDIINIGLKENEINKKEKLSKEEEQQLDDLVKQQDSLVDEIEQQENHLKNISTEITYKLTEKYGENTLNNLN